MKVILVITSDLEFTQMMRAALDPARFRFLTRTNLAEADLLLTYGVPDICVLDLRGRAIDASQLLKQVHARSQRLSVLVYVDAPVQADLEEALYDSGAQHVFAPSSSPRALEAILGLMSEPVITTPAPQPPLSTGTITADSHSPTDSKDSDKQAAFLESVSRLSSVLKHSLTPDSLLKEVLVLLREVIGVNRVAIFLQANLLPGAEPRKATSSSVLLPACGLGLPWELLKDIQLSLDAGIGRHLNELSRVVHRGAPEAADAESQKEFQVLRGQVAVPILDREQLVGAAVFDAHLTGEQLTRAELKLIFHLLEQVAVAIVNVQRELDATQKAARLELEAATLQQSQRICANIASRIGNDMMSISTLTELLPTTDLDSDLKPIVGRADVSTKRIIRRLWQLRSVAAGATDGKESSLSLASLLHQAALEASIHVVEGKTNPDQVKISPVDSALTLRGRIDDLRKALAEIILNGLQVVSSRASVSVEAERSVSGGVMILIRDNGQGFGPEAIRNAGTPFYTDKSSAVGLGLYVARMILNGNGGKLVLPERPEAPGIVRVFLPTQVAQ